jgi:hypothetical protein
MQYLCQKTYRCSDGYYLPAVNINKNAYYLRNVEIEVIFSVSKIPGR